MRGSLWKNQFGEVTISGVISCDPVVPAGAIYYVGTVPSACYPSKREDTSVTVQTGGSYASNAGAAAIVVEPDGRIGLNVFAGSVSARYAVFNVSYIASTL